MPRDFFLPPPMPGAAGSQGYFPRRYAVIAAPCPSDLVRGRYGPSLPAPDLVRTPGGSYFALGTGDPGLLPCDPGQTGVGKKTSGQEFADEKAADANDAGCKRHGAR